MNIAINGTQLLIGLSVLAVSVVATIALYRYYLKHTALKEMFTPTWIKKHPTLDVFKQSHLFLRMGLVCSLGVACLAFSYTNYQAKTEYDNFTLELPDDLLIVPPSISEPPPPPPILLLESFDVEEEPIFEDMTVEENTINEPPPPPPPPPVVKKPAKRKKVVRQAPKEVIEESQIFEVVEQMPRFPGCEDIAGDDNAKRQCAERALLTYFAKCLKYPRVAQENGIEGVVVIRFVVDTDGKIVNPTILRDIGGGCGEEALRVVNKMNDLPQRWTPGKQQNTPVKVQFNLPVRFKLDR